ncbi:MAG TPA: FAD-binding oxidoreductase [Gaiellales bacterium]
MTMPSDSDILLLRADIAGAVITADDDTWDTARQAWNLVADQHPALVVVATDPDDVSTTVQFARTHGLRVAPQSTGHGAPSLGDLDDTILLRTAPLNAVTVDADARTAQVGAGAVWREVVGAAAPHGLTALHGFSGGVGVAGYTLGGGLGWLARQHGLASGHVRSFEVVTADGDQLHVDAEHEPDLYWALRGGGGSPVVVTSFELELFPLREAFAGSLLWPIEQAREVAHAYLAWLADLPDTLSSTLRLMRFPPLPALPEPLRGRQLVSITLVSTGSEAEGNELVAPLRAIAPVYLDTLAMVPSTALGDVAGDPPGPAPGLGGALLLRELGASAIDAFVDLAGPGVETPLLQFEIRQLGGALRTPPADAGVIGAIDAEALVYGVGVAATPELGEAIGAALAEARERMAPWLASPDCLLTFDDRGSGLRALYPAAVADRLISIIDTYDPEGLLVANQVVG